MPKCVTHLIAGLGLGGAETMLYQVLSYRQNNNVRHRVISLGVGSYYEQPIRELGIELIILPFKNNVPIMYLRLKKELRNTDTLCCWMYYGNLIGRLAFGRLRGTSNKKIIWNIRHSSFDSAITKRKIIITNKLCAKLSKSVTTIAYNGNEARKAHEAIGYSQKQGVVLDNGCDTSRYCPDLTAKDKIKKQLGISNDIVIILSVAKDEPVKDLPSFIKAFSSINKSNSNTVAIMCGRGVDKYNEQLTELILDSELILDKNIFLLGVRHDIPVLMAGCDLFVLHSASEAFPNVLIQAMSCKCLCVSTDVGDAKRILDDADMIAMSCNPDSLKDVMKRALSLNDDEIELKRVRNRQIVLKRYDINAVVREYEKLY